MRRVALLVAVLAVSASAADATALAPSTRPPQLTLSERCLNRAERRQTLRFGAADGTRLVGVLLGKGPRGIVLAHQSSGNLCQWFPYARTLARRGFRVLAFDFRTCGASDIPRVQTKARRFDLDVVAAVNVLRRRGVTSIVLAGGSLGASAVVVVASRLQPQVQGVISLSSPPRAFDLDVAAAAGQLQVPVLFVAAEDDGEFADDARQLYGLAATPDKQLIVLSAGGHGTSLPRLPVVRDALDAFFSAHSSAG
jgi:pimeloyl-ACP methyl ester carboxylesterase